MERTERLLDLLALLLDTNAPVSWADVRASFPDDYGGSADAAERKFERDKAELLELGIPLMHVPATEDSPEGYLVDKRSYYLPEAGLTPDEVAMLFAAGSAALATDAFPGRQDLVHALRKIAFFTQAPPPLKAPWASPPELERRALPAHLDQLWHAIGARKSVELSYYSPRSQQLTQRRVDPWGLALRQGLWTLVGHCHLRGAVRVFHVHRVRSLTVNALRPRSPDYAIPDSFRLDDWVASWPWQHRFHAPMDVTVHLTAELAPIAERLFGVAAHVHAAGGEVVVRATHLEGLLRAVLALAPNARIAAPADAVARFTALATDVLRAHGGAP